MTSLRGVLFDVGGVLLTIDYGILAAEARNVTDGVAPCAAAFGRAERSARPDLDVWLRTSTSESNATRRRFLTTIWDRAWTFADKRPPASAFDAWSSRIEEQHRRLNIWRRPPYDAPVALRALLGRGLTTGVVSNADGRVATLLTEAELADYFPVILDSHVEGVEKPDPEIFRRALARLNLQADETLYVGDFYSVDVVGARRAGLGAVLMAPDPCWKVEDVPQVTSLTDLVNRLDDIVAGTPSPWLTTVTDR